MAEIALRRLGDQRVDRRRAYRIFLDGRKVGAIRSGESQKLEVSPGRHGLQLKIDWCSSEKLSVEAKDDAVVSLVCRPTATQRSRTKLVFEGLYLMTFGRGRYIDLRRA
jgi:hypothetical protein